MDVVICPHCNSHRIVTAHIPKDVVAIMPCPMCHELAVMYRDKVVPLSRRIIERGSKDEQKAHLAQVIAEFLEAGILPLKGLQSMRSQSLDDADLDLFDEAEAAASEGISDQEIEHFVRIELKSLDDPTYFRKHFG